MLSPEERRILEMLSQSDEDIDASPEAENNLRAQMQNSPGELLLQQTMQDPNNIQRLIMVIKNGLLANDQNARKGWELMMRMAGKDQDLSHNLNLALKENPHVSVIEQQLKLNQLAKNPSQMLKELALIYNMPTNKLMLSQGMQHVINEMKLGLMAPKGSSQEKKADMASDMLAHLYQNSPAMKTNIEKALKGNQVAIDQLKQTNGNVKNVLKASLVFELLTAVIAPKDKLKHTKKPQVELEQSGFLPFSDFGHEQHHKPSNAKLGSKPKPTLDIDEELRLKHKR
jgi:hypothetical protein